jgi:hypothetical protein
MRRWLQSFLLASLVLAASACSSASGGAHGSSTSALATTAATSASTATASSTAASSSSNDPKADAQAALDAYWAMLKRLFAAPDPSDPEIAQRAVDPSLSSIRDQLTTRQATGQVVQYDGATYHIDTTVTSATTAAASFSGCIVDGARLIDSRSGAVLNDKVTTTRIQGSMVLADGAWKVQRYDVLRKVDGEVGCDTLA